MLRVPQHHPGHKHRGRGCCTISDRPTPSFAPPLLATSHPPLATALLTPIIPVHPRNSPVSSIIPVHTQKQGGGGCFFTFHCRLSTVGCELSSPPNSFVFSRCSYYYIIYMNNTIVGAPTFCKSLSTGATTLLPLSRSLARHSPLTPIIPVHAQNRGVGFAFLNFQPSTLNRSPFSLSISCSPLATHHSPLSPMPTVRCLSPRRHFCPCPREASAASFVPKNGIA
jgi:hypothetical protein